MEKQEWKGMQLDKDLLIKGNKIYPPDTCVFIPAWLNTFAVNPRKGKLLLGVNWHKRDKKYGANIRNPFTNTQEYLGNFDSEVSAHNAWVARKNEILLLVMEKLNIDKDSEIGKALLNRYPKL